MKLKKVLMVATAVALTAAVAIGATLAYLTDTDEDVNVMTLGNVYIEQIEQERVNDTDAQTELTDFEQNQPLLPAVYPGSSIPWADPSEWVVPNDEAWKVLEDNTNVIDKFVTVKNTGKSDAYVRTIFAFEEDSSLIHYVANGANITEGATWIWEENVGTIELDGTNYSLYVATYTAPVKPGATTIPSLKQVYLDKAATNEYCQQFGKSYDILVFSQAVQTEGFDNADQALNKAFGEITAASNPWENEDSSYTPASKALVEALAGGGDVTLSSSMVIADDTAAAKNVITKDTVLNFADRTITLDLPNATSSTANWVGVNVDGGKVVFDGTTGGVVTAANTELYAVVVRNDAELTINGGNYVGGTTAVSVTKGTLIINGGYFAAQSNNTSFVINCIDTAYRNGEAKVIIQGGSFLNWNPAAAPCENPVANFVAEGYKVVEETVADGTLYTVVTE